MSTRVAIVGGTGVGDELFSQAGDVVHVPTAHGTLRGKIVKWDGTEIVVLRRHAAGHRLPPHQVPYAAMAEGLVRLGIRQCLASAAVGSLRRDWLAGTLVVCSDFLDASCRRSTLFDRSVVHTDFTDPFGAETRAALIAAAPEAKPTGTYVGVNGPRYETPSEIGAFRELGGDVVGMTAATEAILMKEAGIDYGCLAIVTNFGTGLGETPLSHGDVDLAMKAASARALAVLRAAAERLART